MSYEHESSESGDKQPDRAEGAMDILRRRVEGLHGEIDQLAQQLRPVCRDDSPEKVESKLETIPESELTELSTRIDTAIYRLAGIRSRLVI